MEEQPQLKLPRTYKRIAYYTVTRDGKPTRLSDKLPHFPYAVLPNVLLESEDGMPTRFETHHDDVRTAKERLKFRRRARRQAKSAILRTRCKASELEQSIHYDSPIAQALGPYEAEYKIVPTLVEITN